MTSNEGPDPSEVRHRYATASISDVENNDHLEKRQKESIARQLKKNHDTSPSSPPPNAPDLSRMQLELADLRENNVGNKQLGDFAEAVVAGLAVLNGEAILQQHNPGDSSHGLDIQTIDENGKVWTYEVKGTRESKTPPTGRRYSVGRQGSANYISNRSLSAPVSAPDHAQVGDADDQMGSRLVQVNIIAGTIAIWTVDDLGNRLDPEPTDRYDLDRVVYQIDTEL